MNKEIDTQELLKYAVSQGIINLDDVRENMEQKERKRLLKEHKYSIFQGSDGRWRTTVPDGTAKNGRKPIAKKTRKSLEDAIVEFYVNLEDKEYIEDNIPEEAHKQDVLVKDLYSDWIFFKKSHTKSSGYIKRLNSDWKRFYQNDPIAEMKVKDLSRVFLDKWLHDKIKNEGLTKTSFYNMSLIIRQSLEYACMSGIDLLSQNPMDGIKINTKLFVKRQKPSASTQVYLTSEQKLIADECNKRLQRNSRCTTPLAIMLNFQIGLRIGELVAIKWSDIDGGYLHINRMESEDYIIKEGHTSNIVDVEFDGRKIVDWTKSSAGIRKIYLNDEAKSILEAVRRINEKCSYYDQDYIFISSQKKTRSTARTITSYLEKLCCSINIQVKSNHKIRKTYISSLFDNNINIDTIRKLAGHENEKTTLKNYCYDQNDEKVIENRLESAKNCNISLRVSSY